MNEINITSAQYVAENSVKIGVSATIDGKTFGVPLDPANRHYAEIMRQVEAGELVIQEAE